MSFVKALLFTGKSQDAPTCGRGGNEAISGLAGNCLAVPSELPQAGGLGAAGPKASSLPSTQSASPHDTPSALVRLQGAEMCLWKTLLSGRLAPACPGRRSVRRSYRPLAPDR